MYTSMHHRSKKVVEQFIVEHDEGSDTTHVHTDSGTYLAFNMEETRTLHDLFGQVLNGGLRVKEDDDTGTNPGE